MFFNYQLDLGFQQLMANQFAAKSPNLAANQPLLESTNELLPYEGLVNQTIDAMGQIYARPMTVDAEFGKRVSMNGRFTLHTHAWEITSRRKSIATLRMVYIQGQKMEIINTWIFPKRCDHMPVFAAELISVSGVHRVAFIDIQVPGLASEESEEVEMLTAPLSSRFSLLPCDESPPLWATEASLGNYTYARQADSNWTSTIQDCYCAYLDTYLSMYATGSTSRAIAKLPPQSDVTETLSNYQEHHMSHSPGSKFLSNLFGAEWTKSFLTKFVFAKP